MDSGRTPTECAREATAEARTWNTFMPRDCRLSKLMPPRSAANAASMTMMFKEAPCLEVRRKGVEVAGWSRPAPRR